MPNAFTLGKRAFTIAVAAATILWAAGLSAFALPLPARAYENGDLIKTESNSAVYYYFDGERFTFTNDMVYFTWYTSFANIDIITETALASIPIGGNIVVRPGTEMIKVQSNSRTYVVTRDGEIIWVETAEVAQDLYGDDWNQWIRDVADVFFTDYDEGVSMTEAAFMDGMLVASGSDIYLIWDGEKRLVTDAGFTANRFQDKYVITESSVDLSDYPTGDTIDGEVPALTDTSQQSTTDVVSEGDLNVSLSSDTPESMTVPAGATNVPFLAVDFEADGSDVTVSNLVFDFTGVAETDVLVDVYLYEDGMRLTNGKSINSSTRQVSFSSLDWQVMDGDTRTLWVTGDVDPALDVVATAGFELDDAGITSTAADVGGDFPIEGEQHTLTDADTVGTVEVEDGGTISDVTVGEDGAEIAEFSLDVSDEDAMIESITLNVDSADDHDGYELWQGSTMLAEGENIGNDLVLFDFEDAYTITDGNSKTFNVTANIGGESGDTIATGIEEEADVNAIGGDFGFGMIVDIGDGTPDDGDGYDATGGECDAAGDDCSFTEIVGGDLTFAFNGPDATEDLLIGGQEQVIFDFAVTAENFATVNSLEFDIAADNLCDGADENFTSFEIKNDDGVTIAGPEETGCASDVAATLVFEDEFDVEAGETLDLTLVVDVEDGGSAADGEVISATLDMSEVDAEDASGDSLTPGTEIIPAADLAGNDLELTDSSLDIDVSATPSTATVVKGSQDVDMAGFAFEAGQASDIMVTDADFSILVETAAAGTEFEGGEDTADFEAQDYVLECSLYDGDGALVDGPESPDADAELHYDGFEWTIPSGNTENLVVNCNLANLDVNGGTADRFAVRLDDVIAEDEESETVPETVGGDNDDPDGAAAGVPDTLINVVAVGDVTVDVASDSPDATIIIGNNDGVEVAVFRLTATTEDFVVEMLEFTNSGDDEVATEVQLSYEDENGDPQTAESVLSSGSVTFDNLDIFVPADGTADITLTIDTNEVSATGADSGDLFELTIEGGAAESESVGLSSGELDTDLGGDETASEFELRKTKPTLTLATGSPTGGSTPSFDEVLRFNVAADVGGFVGVDELTFSLDSTDAATSLWNVCDGPGGDGTGAAGLVQADFDLYNIDNLSTALDVDADWLLLESDGSLCEDADEIAFMVLDLTTEFDVDAGSTETFSLEMDYSGASPDPSDSLRVDIPRDSDVDALSGSADPDGSIVWDDDTQGVDATGALVDFLPVRGGTLTF